MIRNSFLFLAVLILTFSASFAQKADTSAISRRDTSAIISAKKIDELSKLALDVPIDTSMIFFHFYNPAFTESFANQILGNTGSASQNLIFSKRNITSPFVFANPFLVYFHNPYKLQHFNTHRPFTDVSYTSSGSKETSEQVLTALHTQNANEFTNIGLLYELIASRGIYLNQEAKTNRFSLFGSYDKDNYSVYSNVSVNRARTIENGGLYDVPGFLSHQASDPIAYRMYLEEASSSLKNLNVFVTQSYRFKKAVKDTSNVLKEKDLPFMVNHTFRYDRLTRIYKDRIPSTATDTLGFYDNFYYSQPSAYDSAFHHNLENSFQISGDEYKFLPGFIMGAKHQLVRYTYLYPKLTSVAENLITRDTLLPANSVENYNNLSVYAMLLFKEKSNITYQGKFEYFFSGYRLNDILTDFSLNYKLNSKGATVSAFGKFYATEPDYYLKHYYSSHFKWNTAFPKIKSTSAFVSFTSGNGTVYAEGGLNLLDNYIYLNNMARPAKADKNILVSSFRIEKKFKWGGFNHIHKIIAQKVNHEEFLQLPLLAYGNTSYYENAFFKSALKFQIGLDFYFNSGYYADSYMPATGMFYRQDISRVGDYPFLDAFLNWKIKSVRFFLKYVNALAGTAGHNYFTTYGYPMNPGSLKFGLSWTFYD